MKMTVYACGGCGVNLLTPFVKNLGKAEPGFAEIHPVFIDTSRSNLKGEYPEDNLFLIDGLDGSGKKRDANYKIINEKAPEVLHRFKPTPFNVVIHSTSGGSGSVIGSVLTSALLARGENVVVMMAKYQMIKLSGGILSPATEEDVERLKSFKNNEQYEVEIKKQRNPAFHRKVFAFFGFCFDCWSGAHTDWEFQDVDAQFDTFRKNLTVLAGFKVITYKLDGSFRCDAESLSYANMEQERFEQVYQALINAAIKHVFNNTKDDNIINRLYAFF